MTSFNEWECSPEIPNPSRTTFLPVRPWRRIAGGLDTYSTGTGREPPRSGGVDRGLPSYAGGRAPRRVHFPLVHHSCRRPRIPSALRDMRRATKAGVPRCGVGECSREGDRCAGAASLDLQEKSKDGSLGGIVRCSKLCGLDVHPVEATRTTETGPALLLPYLPPIPVRRFRKCSSVRAPTVLVAGGVPIDRDSPRVR